MLLNTLFSTSDEWIQHLYVPDLFKNMLLSRRGNSKTHLLACNFMKYLDKALLAGNQK
jgi:hypothetical protein